MTSGRQNLQERLALVRTRIENACRAAGRDPGEVQLLAVSKLKPASTVEEAYLLGQRSFGENYAAEAVGKIKATKPGPEWHFIGRIQTNKVRVIANQFAFIHSVDRIQVAERLDRATLDRQDIFIQLNVADEESKGGVTPDSLDELMATIAERCPRLRVIGLAAMPPLSPDPELTRPHFRAARELLARLRGRFANHPLDQLSMGTSADFAVAIAEGATWIRVGTDIFGPRTGSE